MLYNIRPHQLFNLVKSASYEERMVRIVLPVEKSPILLDTAVLLALAKVVKPRTFFEFGTFLGIETMNIAANLAPEARLYTLDLDDASIPDLHQDEHDKPLTKIHMEMRQELAFLGSTYDERITRLYGDSKRFDFSSLRGRIDMVYVDGGHDVPTVISDSENAFRMLSGDHATCIVWHDYQTDKYPQVTDHLSGLSSSLDLFHVEETNMVFFLRDVPGIVCEPKT